MKVSSLTRMVLEQHPDAEFNEPLLILLVWVEQGLKLRKKVFEDIQQLDLALPATILRAKARSKKK